MDGIITNLPIMGPLLGSAAFLAHNATNGLTIAWPKRPVWAGYVASVVFGLLFTILLALALLPLDEPWTRQTYAQIILVGLMAGASAAGANGVQRKADQERTAKVYER
jgi:hypothetical protein